MRGQTHGGKGSTQRKTNHKKFANNWDAIFNKKQEKSSKNKK
jgi:stalled ribosome alternative rescue factor ArfA